MGYITLVIVFYLLGYSHGYDKVHKLFMRPEPKDDPPTCRTKSTNEEQS